jgi:Flp pilus assembly protein TadG
MRRRSDADSGSVTAELAVCLPVLVLLLAVALSAVTVSAARIRAADGAREAARALARGDRALAARAVGRLVPGARLSTAVADGEVTATVQLLVHPLASWLPSVTVTERAVAAAEPAAEPAAQPVAEPAAAPP